jgi:sec-independent protein translocase protein TatA
VFDLGFPELVVILLIALLLFGAKRLPEISRSLTRSASEFKNGFSDGKKKSDAEVAREVGETARDVRDGIQQVKHITKGKGLS